MTPFRPLEVIFSYFRDSTLVPCNSDFTTET